MRTVLISYDLNSIHKDYGDVISYIKSLGAWARPLKSQWLVKTDLSPINIINDLRAHGADGDDSLLVSKDAEVLTRKFFSQKSLLMIGSITVISSSSCFC